MSTPRRTRSCLVRPAPRTSPADVGGEYTLGRSQVNPRCQRVRATCKVRAVQSRARMLSGLAIVVAACVMGAFAPSTARAYEDQWTLGVGLGYAHAFPHDAPHP